MKFADHFIGNVNLNFDNIFSGNYNIGSTVGSLLYAIGYFGMIIAILGIVFGVKAQRRCAQ